MNTTINLQENQISVNQRPFTLPILAEGIPSRSSLQLLGLWQQQFRAHVFVPRENNSEVSFPPLEIPWSFPSLRPLPWMNDIHLSVWWYWQGENLKLLVCIWGPVNQFHIKILKYKKWFVSLKTITYWLPFVSLLFLTMFLMCLNGWEFTHEYMCLCFSIDCTDKTINLFPSFQRRL